MRKHDTRNQSILDLYDAGAPLRSIGKQFGLSAERIRQICSKERTPRGYGRQVYKDPALAAKLLRLALDGESAGQLRQHPAYIQRWFRELNPFPFIGASTPGPDFEQQLEVLRRAAAELGNLTPASYRQWAAENGETKLGNLRRLFGDFRAACDAAGVESDYVCRDYDHRWTTDEYRAILIACADAAVRANTAPTYSFYGTWRNDDHPSVALIRCTRDGVRALPFMRAHVRNVLRARYLPIIERLEGGEWCEP